jgi:hypothetical protein
VTASHWWQIAPFDLMFHMIPILVFMIDDTGDWFFWWGAFQVQEEQISQANKSQD